MRDQYLIDRHHVVFDSGGGWHCVCAEFTLLKECRHTRESMGRRAAQELIRTRVRPTDGTLAAFSNHVPPEGG